MQHQSIKIQPLNYYYYYYYFHSFSEQPSILALFTFYMSVIFGIIILFPKLTMYLIVGDIINHFPFETHSLTSPPIDQPPVLGTDGT